MPGRLLGGHVARRPRDLVDALHHPGLLQLDHEAEIEQDDPAIGRDHHVGGLEVAVDDVVAVQGHHAHRQLRDRRAQPRLVEPAAGPDILEEVNAPEQVHREEPLRAVGLQAMQADQVRVADIGGRAELALEAVEPGPVNIRQQLERDAIAPHEVHRLEDDPHAAAPQLADQPVVAQPAGRQRLVVHRLAGRARARVARMTTSIPGTPGESARRGGGNGRCTPRPSASRPPRDAAGPRAPAGCAAASPATPRRPARDTTGCQDAAPRPSSA